jgi:hypothetical protein
MSEEQQPTFTGGTNIAMKLPPQLYEQTITFYKDVMRLPMLRREDATCVFTFGPMQLWLDRVPTASHAEVWLEFVTNDTAAAADYLQQHAVVRRDEIEPLPEGFDGYWITNPAGIIHLVSRTDE